MRKTLKFLHTVASIGFAGSLMALLVLHASLPDPADLERFATLRLAMAAVAKWILFPSMGLVLVSGLLAMIATPSFQSRGWVWAKLATGITVFEGTLVAVLGPMERAAAQAESVLAGASVDAVALTGPLGAERGSFWVILVVAAANVALGVWRPRFSRKEDDAESTPEAA